ncbi:hypothetical protein R4Z09_10800 [Niallia oryzisoli]|uniref:Uncharacterized protein n=1 Tax=Niallia oryzisoli TaxID=1737571 RepID=A0ABZ2CND2_9BACI
MANVDRIEEGKVWGDLHPKVKRGVLAIKENAEFKDANGNDASHMFDVMIRTTPNQVRALKAVDALSEHEIENGKFIFAFFQQARSMEERFPTLTKQDVARLMFIGTYVSWGTNRLQSDNGKKHYTKKDLQELVEMSGKRFNELFKRLKDENVISEAETGELFVNPTIFYRGDLKKHEYDISNLQHTRLFKKTVRDLYEQFKGRRLGQLSTIYSILPFLNFNTNIVCFNPEETAEGLIRPMNLENLSALLGYQDTHKLKTALNGIKVDGKPVFTFVEDPCDRRQKRIIVNPRVVYGGNGESLKAIKALFN